MVTPKKSIRARSWMAATAIAVAVSVVVIDLVSPATAAERRAACEIDLGWLLSAAGEGGGDRTTPRTLRWRGDLPPPSPNSRFADHRLVGWAEADLRVAGMPTTPRVTGEAELVEGVYEHLLAGTLIENLTIAITAADSNVMRVSFTGTDGDTGAIAGGGSIVVEPGGGLLIDGSADLTNVTPVRRDDIVATVTGTLAYVGTPCRGRFEGRVETTTVDIRLADPLPPSVVEIEVVEIGAEGDTEPSVDRRAPGEGWSGDLDLAIEMPGAVFVRGRGIESEWSGNLTLTGGWAKPELRGVLSLVRGQISFAGRAFVLSEGTIVFERGQELSPLIDLTAIHEGKDITALLNVMGSAAAPVVVLTSQPEFPDGEILARVMFGKSVARLSPAQALRVAAALRALSRGETLSEDVFGLARTLLGIDILAEQRKRRESGDGDRRLDRDRQRDEQSGPRPVEIEISPGVSVAAEQEEDEGVKEGSLGIIWKWDY